MGFILAALLAGSPPEVQLRVLDTDGQPVAAAEVGPLGASLPTRRSDDAGRVRWAREPGKRLSLWVTQPEFLSGTVEIEPDQTDAEVRLVRGGVVEGSARWEDGTPAKGVLVRTVGGEATVSDDGTFRISGVVPGPAPLVGSTEGVACDAQFIDLALGAHVTRALVVYRLESQLELRDLPSWASSTTLDVVVFRAGRQVAGGTLYRADKSIELFLPAGTSVLVLSRRSAGGLREVYRQKVHVERGQRLTLSIGSLSRRGP